MNRNIANESCGHFGKKVSFSEHKVKVLMIEKLENRNVVKGKKMHQYFAPRWSLNILPSLGYEFFTLLWSSYVFYLIVLYSSFSH